MKSKFLIYLFFFLLLFLSFSFAQEQKFTLLVLDSPYVKDAEFKESITDYPGDDTLPRNFRKSTDPFKDDDKGPKPSREGLDNLNISGSGAFSTGQFEKLLSDIKAKNLDVVDLRQESHGFVNNMCVSWYGIINTANEGKNSTEVMEIERSLLQELLAKKEIIIKNIISKDNPLDPNTWKIADIPVIVKSVKTEEELVKEHGCNYLRLAVMDHNKPQDYEVDNFISFCKNLPEGTWLHFHCRAGRGRTTTFMVMYDMLHNYTKLSAEDIIRRQWLLGGANLAEVNDKGNYKIEQAKERFEFLFKFHKYCQDQGPDYKISWSEWVKTHN